MKRLVPVLLLAAVALGGLGTWFQLASEGARTSGAGNAALLDTAATTEVTGQVTEGLERIFSYSYDNVEVTERAAKDVLAGDAVAQYDELFAQVRAKAPVQRLVLSTTVSTAGVRSLDGDTARLLVFLDQAATRVDTTKSSGSAAVLSVTAQRLDGRWRITALTTR